VAAARRESFRCSYGEDGGLDADAVLGDLDRARERLRDNICDTTSLLHDAMSAGKKLLFEGANGLLLDVDHGTYPFVTSSSTGPHGIGPGAGVSPARVEVLIGTVKAYSTRVGSGPFVSELDNDIGERIRQHGNEFGTTTGRPRRCGWFDVVATVQGVRVSGVTDIALMHLDTLSGFDEVGLCTAYRLDGTTLTAPPAHAAQLERAEPVIEFVPGWKEDLRSVRRFDDLPDTARDYVERLEALLDVPVSIIGVGPDRSQTLVRGRLSQSIRVPEPSIA